MTSSHSPSLNKGLESVDHHAVLRILDVNLNRAAEALRTLEDIARVIREDATSSGVIKELRHQLGQLADRLDRPERLAARCVYRDAGTQKTTPDEAQRSDWRAIIIAACERSQQSLRVLEECSKLINPTLSASFKQLRYLALDQLALVELRLARPQAPFSDAAVYLLVDCSLPLDRFTTVVQELQRSGVDLFQLRDKQADGGKLLSYARAAVQALGPGQVIINDRVDIALASGAGGVHVGQDDLPIQEVQRLSKGRLWIGVSTHDLQQAIQAERAGADYVGCGPTFPSSTKHFDHFAGTEFLQQVSAQVEIPAFAIGGINLSNVALVRQAGFRRIAVSGAVLDSNNPSHAARSLADALQ